MPKCPDVNHDIDQKESDPVFPQWLADKTPLFFSNPNYAESSGRDEGKGEREKEGEERKGEREERKGKTEREVEEGGNSNQALSPVSKAELPLIDNI